MRQGVARTRVLPSTPPPTPRRTYPGVEMTVILQANVVSKGLGLRGVVCDTGAVLQLDRRRCQVTQRAVRHPAFLLAGGEGRHGKVRGLCQGGCACMHAAARPALTQCSTWYTRSPALPTCQLQPLIDQPRRDAGAAAADRSHLVPPWWLNWWTRLDVRLQYAVQWGLAAIIHDVHVGHAQPAVVLKPLWQV